MSITRNRILSLALAVCLLLGMTLAMPGPVAVSAIVGMQEGMDTVVRGTISQQNPTVVGFGGYEWLVIGYDNSGVQSLPDTITLLGKTQTDFGSTEFDTSTNRTPLSNAYNGSLLKSEMDSIYNDFPVGERRLINAVTLDDVNIDPNGYTNSTLSGQLVWPLSRNEAKQSVQPYTTQWWLRTPTSDGRVEIGDTSGNGIGDSSSLSPWSRGVRPAFQLDLVPVLFTSDTSGASAKSNATAGNDLSPAQPVAQNLKLTVKDPTMSLGGVNTTALTKAQGQSFDIDYTSATTGSNNYISCVLVKENEVKYYGKLEAANSGGGNATVKLPVDIPTGSYTLRVFVEEANGDLSTDFASDPVDIPLTVTRALNTDAGLATVAGQTISLTGGNAGDLGDPHTAAIHLPNSVDQVDVSDIVPTDANATVNLYSDALFSQGMNQPITLAEGADTYLYIKVTAEDTTTALYYKVTATRALPGQHVVTVTADPAAGGRPTASPNPATATQLVKLEANPAEGYTFDRWESASPGVTIASPTQLSTTFVMPHEDVAVVACYTANDPDPVDPVDPGSGGAPIVSGAGGGRSGGDRDSGQSAAPVERRTVEVEDLGGYRFRVDLPLLGFFDAYVDGTKLTRGEDYTVTEGSTVLALRESYIAALSPGTHTLRMEFIAADGYIDFVAGAVTGTGSDLPLGMYDDHYVDTSNPNTGDGRGTWLAALLGVVSAAVLVVCRKKRIRG